MNKVGVVSVYSKLEDHCRHHVVPFFGCVTWQSMAPGRFELWSMMPTPISAEPGLYVGSNERTSFRYCIILEHHVGHLYPTC